MDADVAAVALSQAASIALIDRQVTTARIPLRLKATRGRSSIQESIR